MGLPVIKVVQLTVTNRCQCRCRHCGVAKLREEMKEELPLERIDRIFEDLQLAGCLVVDLFGGEPTLRADLFEIIKRGKARGFSMSLETNGYVIDGAYVDRLVAAGLDQIYLSLDDCRAEVHDEIRGRKGSFARAVRALELGAQAGITMHVSIVPPGRDFFIGGGMNRFMRFVLDHGARQVRVLLPRFAGDSIRAGGPLYAGEEKFLFSHVSAEYHRSIYVHTPGTPPGGKNLCTAKQVFCHIMSNGWLTPCPYFPLVFGDAVREPIVDVFERIQSHPLVRLGGDSCPMRNREYIDANLRRLGLDRPFHPIAMENLIDIGAPCRTGCADCTCGRRTGRRPAEEIIREIEALAPQYTRVEFYGGDAFGHDDLEKILRRVSRSMRILLWTACGPPAADGALMDRLRAFPIEAVKIRLALPPGAGADGAGLTAALEKTAALSSRGFPVYLHVPADLMDAISRPLGKLLYRTGAERLYSFTRDAAHPSANAAACFGREVGSARLLWARREETHRGDL
ncbi:MAG TPA: radical SAM protein [Syntrophales bacterium]|nr:radical SAM protein [Syntrophales bacterium]